MRLLQFLLLSARAAGAAFMLAAGVILGPLLSRQKRTGRPVIAFQAYAEHLLYFYEFLIRKLLLDDRVDVILLTWPHPQFPWRVQTKLRELAVTELGLSPASVVPFWRACWWRFDCMISNDALVLPLLRRTRTCQMFHGPIISNRFFRRGLVRQPVFDTDLAFPFGPYCRDQILAGSSGRQNLLRVHTVGSPRFDKYFHPGRAKGEYLRTLGLSDSRPVVVYAPHWSELNLPGDAGVDLFRGAVGELAKLTVQIIVKLHAMSMVPGAAGGRNWDDLLRAAESSRVRVDRGMEDVDAMLAADVLVTGVSGRAFNVMLLDKPVVLYPRAHPPAGSLAQTAYDMLCRGAVVADSLHELGERVQEALANPQALSDQRRRVAEALFANPGHATSEVARILYSSVGTGV
jgi:hypothetical protein